MTINGRFLVSDQVTTMLKSKRQTCNKRHKALSWNKEDDDVDNNVKNDLPMQPIMHCKDYSANKINEIM